MFLLSFELLKNREQIKGLVSGLVELPGMFTSERDSHRGMSGSVGLGLHGQLCPPQGSSRTQLHLDFIRGRRESG